ncbi:DUF4259 domain-containing protein [Rheinheimera muenzenbergensis]|uniref:DUF4259 domain-containing protein n=1 Tax=Rheinheimera muenzenbergensis TaxID=1193628 RepID=A0ABU8C378_9GAMM
MRFNFIALFFMFFSLQVLAGTWGVGSFENDSASDWVYELEQKKGSGKLLDTIRAVFTPQYIEVDTCSSAIAAAEVVASIKSGNYEPLPESLKKWALENKDVYEPEMSKFTLQALQICKNTKKSELAQLWSESGAEEWLSSIGTLEAKLK